MSTCDDQHDASAHPIAPCPPDGPVALLPAEVEVYDTQQLLLEQMADAEEWEAMRDGADEQVGAHLACVLTIKRT